MQNEQELKKEEALFLKALNLEKNDNPDEGLAIAEELIAKYPEISLADPETPISTGSHNFALSRQTSVP